MLTAAAAGYSRHSPSGLPFEAKVAWIGAVIKHFVASACVGLV